MTDQEVLDKYNRMVEHFGVLPDPDHEPRQFAYYVKLFDYTQKVKEQTDGL